MKVAEYLVKYLVSHDITDTFGIPGGVILDFLYALDQNEGIQAHLCYHEQGAVFAAMGYAQASGRLGVAYATRGPGISNMLTGVAEAYYESIPLLVITAHVSCEHKVKMRTNIDQEMDSELIFSNITKGVIKIESLEDVIEKVEYAYTQATVGRKGPVVLDILSSVFEHNINWNNVEENIKRNTSNEVELMRAAETIKAHLAMVNRPILLIGDGVKQSGTEALVRQLTEEMNIPVLSSRAAQDVMGDSEKYFGYIGSHGIRYGNFILAKSDLIIALGNRMSYPEKSASFYSLMEKKATIRVDIDTAEFARNIPNCINFEADIRQLLPLLIEKKVSYKGDKEWIVVCEKCREMLWGYMIDYPVSILTELLRMLDEMSVIVSDVGNHEFWLSQAYTFSKVKNRILYSKSFGTLGCAIPKSIGAYYAIRKPVICICGDQGFQMNSQELQVIVQNHLPIVIVIVNNQSSGMIRSSEKRRFQGNYVHTTIDSGYSTPDFSKIAYAYGIKYEIWDKVDSMYFEMIKEPSIVEIRMSEEYDLLPYLSKGNPCQNLEPAIEDEIYQYIDKL